MTRKITPPPHKWRTLEPDGTVQHFDDREAAEASGRLMAERWNGSIALEEWSSDYPQDDLNSGWACVGAVYPEGKEPPPLPGRRTSVQDVPVGSVSMVWGYAAPGDFFGGRAGFIQGKVTGIAFTNVYAFTRVVTFDDGREAWCVSHAVAQVLEEPS